MALIPLFIYAPAAESLQEAIPHLARSGLFELRALKWESTQLLELLEARPCVCVFSIFGTMPTNWLFELLQELQKLRQSQGGPLRDPSLRIVLITQDRQIPLAVWSKIGVHEIIMAPIYANSLTFKLSSHYHKAIAAERRREQLADLQVKDLEETPSGQVDWRAFVSTEPLAASEDAEALGQLHEKIEIELDIVDPAQGAWERKFGVAGPDGAGVAWDWKPKDGTAAGGPAPWTFKGDEPKFLPESKTCLLSGEAPLLEAASKTPGAQPEVVLKCERNESGQIAVKVKSELPVKSVKLAVREKGAASRLGTQSELAVEEEDEGKGEGESEVEVEVAGAGEAESEGDAVKAARSASKKAAAFESAAKLGAVDYSAEDEKLKKAKPAEVVPADKKLSSALEVEGASAGKSGDANPKASARADRLLSGNAAAQSDTEKVAEAGAGRTAAKETQAGKPQASGKSTLSNTPPAAGRGLDKAAGTAGSLQKSAAVPSKVEPKTVIEADPSAGADAAAEAAEAEKVKVARYERKREELDKVERQGRKVEKRLAPIAHPPREAKERTAAFGAPRASSTGGEKVRTREAKAAPVEKVPVTTRGGAGASKPREAPIKTEFRDRQREGQGNAATPFNQGDLADDDRGAWSTHESEDEDQVSPDARRLRRALRALGMKARLRVAQRARLPGEPEAAVAASPALEAAKSRAKGERADAKIAADSVKTRSARSSERDGDKDRNNKEEDRPLLLLIWDAVRRIFRRE